MVPHGPVVSPRLLSLHVSWCIRLRAPRLDRVTVSSSLHSRGLVRRASWPGRPCALGPWALGIGRARRRLFIAIHRRRNKIKQSGYCVAPQPSGSTLRAQSSTAWSNHGSDMRKRCAGQARRREGSRSLEFATEHQSPAVSVADRPAALVLGTKRVPDLQGRARRRDTHPS